jgi:type VI secretion system protein VasG
MAPVNLKLLIGRLNDECWQTLDAAGKVCSGQEAFFVEIEHWLLKLLENTSNDVNLVLQQHDVDISVLQRDIQRAIDKLKTGNKKPVKLAGDLIELAQDAWLLASVDFSETRVRSGHLLCALLLDRDRDRLARDISGEFAKIGRDSLKDNLAKMTAASSEAAAPKQEPGAERSGGAHKDGQSSALQRFTTDLTERARAGQIDPIVGRDVEIRQVIDILMRRRQNNPILTGEAGVGKTAVVEGFAQRIADGDVPPPFRGVTLRSLDLGLLQAGASVKGEFENRLRGVIEETKSSPTPVILFIDEAHMLVGAGGQAGQGDAANLLKPALARGELRTIAATTWAEYKKYFERDPALTRRFQVVKVEEPAEEPAIRMMAGLVGKLEKHHGVRVLSEAVEESVRLSSRYISGRQLPDKSVSLLDTACARVAVARTDIPSEIEALRRERDHLIGRIAMLGRETAAGGDHDEEIGRLEERLSTTTADLDAIEQRWARETELVERIIDLRSRLEAAAQAESLPDGAAAGDSYPASAPAASSAATSEASPSPTAVAAPPAPPPPADAAVLREEFRSLSAELGTLQGETPLLFPCVDRHAIAAVVASWTGIPVGRMVADEIQNILSLRDRMEERIVGQSHALDRIARTIRSSRADIADPGKPIGVFFMPGPSGVGKTETALTLAELLYGGEQNLKTINMSEFKEEHKVSLLMGSPPGYVGYGEGGVLTEAVRRTPYSVVLLDEMEKAHPGVQDIFYQVFDKGAMRDGEGRNIDFRNTIIIMTSNAASDAILRFCRSAEGKIDCDALAEAIYPELLKWFKPAFLGRCTILPFVPLGDEILARIVVLKLAKVARRIRERYEAELTWSPETIDAIIARCTEVETGARNIDHIVERTLLPELAGELLSRVTEGESIERIEIGVGDGSFTYTIS